MTEARLRIARLLRLRGIVPCVPLCLAAVVACGAGDLTGGSATASRDSVGVTIVESERPRFDEPGSAPFIVDTAPTVTIGVEEGDAPYQLYRVSDALRLPDGRIVIANAGELRVFDRDGRHVTNVGRTGAGPAEFAEFASPQLYAIAKGLLATDGRVFRVHLFDDTLGFVETRRFALTNEVPRPFLRGIFADGSWLVLGYEGGGLRGAPGTVLESRPSLFRYDSTGEILDSLGTFAGSARYVNSVDGITHFPYLPFTADLLVGVVGNETVTLREDTPELAFRDSTGRVVRLVRWQRARVRSAELWPEYKARSLADLVDANERNQRLYGAFYEKDLPLPEFAPLYQTLRVDAEQRVWLERYRLPGDTARVWDVIDADGAWLGAVSTPQRFTVYRIGRDMLLGRTLDSLGVERVVEYAVRGGG